jgi:hypothetical protein
VISNESAVASLKAVQTLYDASLARPRRYIDVAPVVMSSSDPNTLEGRFGALVVVLAETDSAIISELRQTAAAAVERLSSVLLQGAEKLKERKQIALLDAIAQARELPSLVDIRHGGQTLASNVPVLPGGSPTIYTFPYLGGRLSSRGIVAVERYREQPSVEVFAILYPPALSAEQELALELLGDDDRETLIKPPSMCYAASAVGVAAVVAIVALAATAWGVNPDTGDVIDTTLGPVGDTALDDLITERRRRLRLA